MLGERRETRSTVPIKRVACQHVKDGATVDTRMVDESVAIDLCHECAQRPLSLRLTSEGAIVFIDAHRIEG